MVRRILLGLSIPLVAVVLFFAWKDMVRPRREQTPTITAQPEEHSQSISGSAEIGSNGTSLAEKPRDESLSAVSVGGVAEAGAQGLSSWKRYNNSEYGFEISYPADWDFDDHFENNYGKPPSGHGRPAYAGETRVLFSLEMDGPEQSHEGGGDFEDGAIIDMQVTGTSGNVESWNITPTRPWYLLSSSPADWVQLNSSALGGDKAQTVTVDTNGFNGGVHIVCTGSDPCKLFGEEGGVYRTLASGRVLLISWERMVGGNDFSYQEYFVPMLSSFRLLK